MIPAWSPVTEPLDPSPERAHRLLQHELLHPEYHDQNLMQQFLHWLRRSLEHGLDAASNTSPLGTFGALALFLAVVVLLGWVVSRARRSPRVRPERGAVLTTERVTAADLRARAAAALAEGRPGDALVDGFRALTLRQIEHGRLDDLPGATAHEVATSLGTTYVDQRPRIDGSAALFDLVLYGDRPATRAQAEDVLGLDDDLAARR
ncbi:MAG: DUF4129 domain-containing protein [Marmoricola sp.]